MDTTLQRSRRAITAALATRLFIRDAINLAWLYLGGRGVQHDVAQAMRLFYYAYDASRLACLDGDVDDCNARRARSRVQSTLHGQWLIDGQVAWMPGRPTSVSP
jgi:hypothetical protein